MVLISLNCKKCLSRKKSFTYQLTFMRKTRLIRKSDSVFSINLILIQKKSLFATTQIIVKKVVQWHAIVVVKVRINPVLYALSFIFYYRLFLLELLTNKIQQKNSFKSINVSWHIDHHYQPYAGIITKHQCSRFCCKYLFHDCSKHGSF